MEKRYSQENLKKDLKLIKVKGIDSLDFNLLGEFILSQEILDSDILTMNDFTFEGKSYREILEFAKEKKRKENDLRIKKNEERKKWNKMVDESLSFEIIKGEVHRSRSRNEFHLKIKVTNETNNNIEIFSTLVYVDSEESSAVGVFSLDEYISGDGLGSKDSIILNVNVFANEYFVSDNAKGLSLSNIETEIHFLDLDLPFLSYK